MPVAFDCFCALCAGPLGSFALIGSKSPKALAKRKKRVELEKRERAGEDFNESDEEESEDATSDGEMGEAGVKEGEEAVDTNPDDNENGEDDVVTLTRSGVTIQSSLLQMTSIG